jgi:transcriptional regulator NrdR family protein
MICPVCKNRNSPKKVMATWMVKNGTVKRRRKCTHCHEPFHTVECVVLKEKILLNGVE